MILLTNQMMRREWLTVLRRNRPNRRGEYRVHREIDRAISNDGACRILPQIIVTFPIGHWPYRSGNKATSAIRADVEQDSVDTRRAKSAFITADAGLAGSRRQGPLAVFTGR